MGLLGGSVTLAILRSLSGVKTIGYSHRPSTRKKARLLAVAHEIASDLYQSVKGSDLVILATPIYTFEKTFGEIADSLANGAIVTDVGSTKVLPHRWAAKHLPKGTHYVGSHPIAGSEQRGVEFARDDLFEGADCILTKTPNTNASALAKLKKFWSALGCSVKVMTPGRHDKIFANVSHIPHVTAAALVNATKSDELKFAGKGFIDTSRVASGPANIWADIILANAKNLNAGIDKITNELAKLKKAVNTGKRNHLEKLLNSARQKRTKMIRYKINKKEVIP
jgi:prephenate dehydrogenase